MKLITFGTYGFLSALIGAQLSMASTVDKADRAGVDAKKTARAMKHDVKKGARKATGQDNAWDDAKDTATDAAGNIKDEAKYQERKLKRESEGASNE